MGASQSVTGDLNGPYLQRQCVNPEVNFASSATVFGAMLLAFAFAFAKELDPRAVHLQVQRLSAEHAGQLHPQGLLAATDGAEVRHGPIELCQLALLPVMRVVGEGLTRERDEHSHDLSAWD